jgi:hypothetical protein
VPASAVDLHRARAFLDACRTSIPRVTYGLGKKVPFLGAVPGREFTQVDCSGFVREAIRLSTSPPLPFPDGSVNQHDWVRAHGFEKSTVPAGLQNDGMVRIAFLRPQDVSSGIGHVVLIAGGKTLESHGGVGPDSRRWDGSSWQAKTYVYVLAQEAQVATISSAAALLASTAPGSMYTVHRGRRYRATLALGFFEQLAPNSEIEARLRNYGFADVHATGSGSVRQAVALWPGPDTTAALDPHIVEVEELPADALAGSQSLGGFDAASAVAALPASPWNPSVTAPRIAQAGNGVAMSNVFSTESIPTHHDGLLIVKMRQDPLPGVASLAMTAANVSSMTTGMSALSFYERAGMINASCRCAATMSARCKDRESRRCRRWRSPLNLRRRARPAAA